MGIEIERDLQNNKLIVRTDIDGTPAAVPFDLIAFKAIPAASPKRLVQKEFVSVAYNGQGGALSVNSKSSGVGTVSSGVTGVVDVPFATGKLPASLDYLIATPRYVSQT